MYCSPADLDRANQILSSSIGADAHVDTLQRLLIEGANLDQSLANGHVDYPRLCQGKVSALVCALWTPTYYPLAAARARTFELLSVARQFCSRSPHFKIAANVNYALEAIREGSIAMLLSLEGCDALGEDFSLFDQIREAGISSVGLTHVTANWLADSATAFPVHGGLSRQGCKAIEKMNSLGLLVDVSHSSDHAVRQVLEISSHPVVASHSGCRALCENPRNLPDSLIEEIAAKGGLVCIAVHSAFLHPDDLREAMPTRFPENLSMNRKDLDNYLAAEHRTALQSPTSTYATLENLVDHIDHAVRLAGVKGVALGSDFDGGIRAPRGFEDISKRPQLAAQLLDRGYSAQHIQSLFGENLLELLQRVQSAG